MIEIGFEELVIFVFWFVGISLYLIMGMTNDAIQKQQGVLPRSGRGNGLISNSLRTISSYLKIVSSGASTVARSAATVASSIVDKNEDANRDQVNWVGFDELEIEGDVSRRVLLLGYRSGFQVWDVEEANNVRDLVSRNDGSVSFMQMLPIPLKSKMLKDKFEDSRPLLVLCTDGTININGSHQDRSTSQGTIANRNSQDPSNVSFYSLRSQSYIHELKFQSSVYSIRCSSRVIAISQATQIHCLDAMTLERQYSILTNPIVLGCPSFGGLGYGPLAIGTRWLAYSGNPIVVTDSGRVNPQHLTPSASNPTFASNGSLVAHYAKESSKQLAQGITTLGDMGYKKLSRYCSELIPDGNNSLQSRFPSWKGYGALNGHSSDVDNFGMVIVRDIVSKDVLAQFRAHKSPISALCFDPSGTLLVTASVQGHNINVFKIMPGLSGNSSDPDSTSSCVHLYRLQRGLTNAVIQDISFSSDSNWIMISSSRGTSHLFAINPVGGSVNLQSGALTKSPVQSSQNCVSQMPNQQIQHASGPPLTLSPISRIHNGNGWRGTVTGAAAAATGRATPPSGAIASCFHKCKDNSLHVDNGSIKSKHHLLVFSPSGNMVQYALRIGLDQTAVVSGPNCASESALEGDSRLAVEAIQKWNICQKQNRRERDDNIDIYGDNGSYGKKIFTDKTSGNPHFSEDSGSITEEKHHLYIAEAELQMHQALNPLWAKPEIYFQSIVSHDIDVDKVNLSNGETEIERIPTRMIEARSKDLVPVFDYLHSPKPVQIRVSSTEYNIARPYQKSYHPENGNHPWRSFAGAHHSAAINGTSMAELQNGKVETSQNSPRSGLETGDAVNNNDGPKTPTQLEIVNNIESSKMKAQLKYVNNHNGSVKMENRFEDEGDEFD